MILFVDSKGSKIEQVRTAQTFVKYLADCSRLPEGSVAPKRIHGESYGDVTMWTFTPLVPDDPSKDHTVELIIIGQNDGGDVFEE